MFADGCRGFRRSTVVIAYLMGRTWVSGSQFQWPDEGLIMDIDVTLVVSFHILGGETKAIMELSSDQLHLAIPLFVAFVQRPAP